MLGVAALFRKAERRDAVQLGEGALRRREQDFVHLGVLRPATGGASCLADEERKHHEHHQSERDLDRDLRDLGRRVGQAELRLRRLDVVRGFTGLDDARDDDRDLGRRGDTGDPCR